MSLAYVRPAKRGAHTFPHRDIKINIRRARAPRVCDSEALAQPPAGHVRSVGKGDEYVHVAIEPLEPRDRWRHRTLCAGCAIFYGLARELEEAPSS